MEDDEDYKGVGGSKSIAERRAAKFGFNAQSLNKTALFRTASSLPSPAARSPRITIPPGISPAALLDSPIMLPNTQALPSPTTGTFPLHPHNHYSSMLSSLTAEDGDRASDVGSSKFMPYEVPNFPSGFSSFKEQGADVDYQALVSMQAPMDFEFPAELPKADITKNCAAYLPTEMKMVKNMIMNSNLQNHCSEVAGDRKSLPKEPSHGEDVGTNHLVEGDQKAPCPSAGTVRTSEDGYNWRKYGQKQVKGSEYPRSYYKCTHPNCQVKKKVERSYDGQITEIIYKGTHSHAKPQPNRRASPGSAFSIDETSTMVEGSGTCKVEGGSIWRNIHSGSRDIKLGSDWRADGVERTSSASVVSELSDPLSTTHARSVGVFESAGTPELSSTLASHDENEDGATQGSISLGDDGDGDESDSKRRNYSNAQLLLDSGYNNFNMCSWFIYCRRTDSYLIETNLASRAVREPRVVVQIESDVDILDDGYRWRKYGQKVVKGNPNPRSYYKCTSAGCSVRKHVERAAHNLKFVITTYEGKHNHEVPAARNSGQINSSGGNVPPPAPNSQAALTLPRNINVLKHETHVQDLAPHFDRKLEFNNDYLSHSFLGNFSNDMKFGASSIYQMKFPPLQNTMPYASLGLNSNCNVTHQAGSIASILPDFPISLPLNLPLAGYDFNSGKPIGSVESFLLGQQLKENDGRLLRPKQEQKDDNLYDACLPIVDHGNALSSSSSSSSSPSSSLYHQIMRSYPS